VYNNEKINNVYKIEDSIFQMMQAANIGDNMDEGYKSTIDNLTNLHNNNYTTIIKIAEYNRYLLVVLVLTIIIQGFVLFFMVIKITHRISGPIYVISNYFREIIEGNIPEPRPLRNKDELKEFYNLFIALVESFKKEKK
jgi:nitrogen fixation/metabolism regulation signal transduction histidine kinase